MTDQQRFEALCAEEAQQNETLLSNGINTYGEKRLHRVLKRFVAEEGGGFEVPVGRYVADAMRRDTLYEIQTRSLRPLIPKLTYYLEQTELQVMLVLPLLASKRVIRMEPGSGEVLRSRMVYRGGRAIDALPRLYPLGELLRSPRLTVAVARIHAEELRTSERVRYRKSGAYDGELFPRALEEWVTLSTTQDYLAFLPPDLTEFTAAQYSAWSKLKQRDLYSALNTLCTLGLLERELVGKKYEYRKKAGTF